VPVVLTWNLQGVRRMRDSERYGRAERMLRARRRRLAADHYGDTGEWSAGPPELLALATEAERVRYTQMEKAYDLDARITAVLGPGWDVGDEPDPWVKGDHR
jgi:hypothetical protein